jgi:hypothetical protein
MSERHAAEKPVIPTVDQQAVFDLMHERLRELFGPGGSFRITLGRATADDAVFVDTVAETIAWQVAAAMEPAADGAAERQRAAQHALRAELEIAQPEHEEIWAHIEAELLRQRTGDEALTVSRRAA